MSAMRWMTASYRCPTCGATKEIRVDPERSDDRPPNFPFDVPCGWRGCTDRAVKVDALAAKGRAMSDDIFQDLPATADDWSDIAYVAWTIIANVSEGDWTEQTSEWRLAAIRWRDRFNEALAAEARPCRHSRTTYNEQDGTLWCEQCHSWVISEALAAEAGQ